MQGRHSSRGTGRRALTQRIAAIVTVLFTMFASVIGVALTNPTPASAASDSLGTDYWVAFPTNYSETPELTVFITGPTATTGTIAIPGLSFTAPFTVTPGTVTSVTIPTTAEIVNTDVVEHLGIHVTAAAEVTVYGLNRIQFTTDAYLGLPSDILGTSYIMLGYEGTSADETTVVGTQANTTVTITPVADTGTHTAGAPFNITMNQGDTYQLDNAGTGTLVTSDKPVAVFGGNNCANVPTTASACDHLVEEMTPTTAWGKSFVTEPLATRIGGDTFRYLASTDATTVKVNGATVATLNRGQFFEQILPAASTITSDKPILVAQYSNGTSFDGVTSDPFEVLVPPYEQFLNHYTVTTPSSGFDTNFVNVVAPTASVGSVTLDGTAIPAASFTAIPGSTFSGAQLPVALGAHTLGGPQPFGTTVYGFADFDSYGYPGGLSLAPVATVTNLDLTPVTSTGAVNTQSCSTATVTDQNNAPVVGVRVDFTVTGVNPTTGFANTAANGTAPFCYTGTVAGADTIGAAVGTVTDSSSRTWTPALTPHTLTVAVTGSGSVTSNPTGITCPGTCSASFPNGTSVALTPTPAAGFAFSGWTGACTGTGACTTVLSADRSVTATFTAVPVTHTLTVATTGLGTVTSNPAGISCPGTCSATFGNGTSVTLTPTPAAGFVFGGWSGACTGTGACTTVLSTDRSVTAGFTAVPVTHTLTAAVTGSGTVTSNPAGISCPGTCGATFANGTSVALTATPAAGFAFNGWSGACTGTAACTVTMSADRSVTATFAAVSTGGLVVTETSEPPTVTAGSAVLHTFTVTNTGTGPQTHVVLKVTYPAGSTVTPSNPSQGTCTVTGTTATCSLGTIAGGAHAVVPIVVRVPAAFTGQFVPTATAGSDQTPTTGAGALPGSGTVPPGNGQAFGFVPPGGTLTTGDASPANPTGGTFTLPNTGTGAAVSLTTQNAPAGYCGNGTCRGKLLTLSPFAGYDDPTKAPKLDISLDWSVVRRYGPAFNVWVQKENPNVAPVLVRDCRVAKSSGHLWWHRHWWSFHRGMKIADPSPCVSKRYIDRHGDSHVEMLVLSGDPKFGRR